MWIKIGNLTFEIAFEDRNAIIVCLPERQLNTRSALLEVITSERWSIRRGRPRSRDLAGGSRHW
jgi:hypothetical protein